MIRGQAGFDNGPPIAVLQVNINEPLLSQILLITDGSTIG